MTLGQSSMKRKESKLKVKDTPSSIKNTNVRWMRINRKGRNYNGHSNVEYAEITVVDFSWGKVL